MDGTNEVCFKSTLLNQDTPMISQNLQSSCSVCPPLPEQRLTSVSAADKTVCESNGSDKSKNFDSGSSDEWQHGVSYTVAQLYELKTLFKKEMYPTKQMRERLAATLKLTWNQVDVWFKNERRKSKKQLEKSFEFNCEATLGLYSPRDLDAGESYGKYSSSDYQGM